MNAISGPTAAAGISALQTTAAVRPMRAVTSNTQRAAMGGADRYESSASKPPLPSVTYGRNGQGGDADHDGDSR